jgi:hypothetical protein
MFPAHFCMAFAAVLACNASKQHPPNWAFWSVRSKSCRCEGRGRLDGREHRPPSGEGTWLRVASAEHVQGAD